MRISQGVHLFVTCRPERHIHRQPGRVARDERVEAHVIEVVVAGKPRRKKVLDEFIFDTSRCMFCALCQEACPTYCLELTQDFELATYSRAGFVWNREMLEQGRETVKYEA